jgi:hypothetical protein
MPVTIESEMTNAELQQIVLLLAEQHWEESACSTRAHVSTPDGILLNPWIQPRALDKMENGTTIKASSTITA